MMNQTRSLRRPYGNQTLIYNWQEERADVKNERIQKPLPSQVDSHHLIVMLIILHLYFYKARSLFCYNIRMWLWNCSR